MGKLLTILGIDEKRQETLPENIFQAEQILTGLQTIYENAPDGNKKEKLATVIAETTKALLKQIESISGTEKPEPKPEEPKEEEKKEEPKKELTFKVGDRFIRLADTFRPYIVYTIDKIEGNDVTISGISGYDKTLKTTIKSVEFATEQFETGAWEFYQEPKKKEKPEKKPKQEKQKKEPAPKKTKQESKKSKSSNEGSDETDYEGMSQEERLDAYDELTDVLLLLEETDEEYEKVKNEIEKLKPYIE